MIVVNKTRAGKANCICEQTKKSLGQIHNKKHKFADGNI